MAHGVRENGVVYAPQAAAPTLARLLQDAGYRTGAFVGAYVLDRRFGLADGFDIYDDAFKRDPEGRAARGRAARIGEVVDAALPWLHQTPRGSSCGCISTIPMRLTSRRRTFREGRRQRL